MVAGAGTGKTRVIVERVRRLLESRSRVNGADGDPLRLPPEAAAADREHPFAGPLLPEQVLVLTYNEPRVLHDGRTGGHARGGRHAVRAAARVVGRGPNPGSD